MKLLLNLLLIISSLYSAGVNGLNGIKIGMSIDEVRLLTNTSVYCQDGFLYTGVETLAGHNLKVYSATLIHSETFTVRYFFMFAVDDRTGESGLYCLSREWTDSSTKDYEMYEVFSRLQSEIIAETGVKSYRRDGDLRIWSFPDTKTEWCISFDGSVTPNAVVEYLWHYNP